jgi:hypothetical protein
MSGIYKATQSPRRPGRTASAVVKNHTCVECPAFGSETCKTLQQLGMYCDTAVAAFEAMRVESRGKRKLAAV